MSPWALHPALPPLLAAAAKTQAPSLWATVDGIWATGLMGPKPVDEPWSEVQHEAAWQALAMPVRLRRDLVARRLDDAILVARAPVPLASAEALADAGLLSRLAARTLMQALVLGRNIVWTGPKDACIEAMVTLAAGGARPGLLMADGVLPLPPRFAGIPDAQAARHGGIDRLVVGHAGACAMLESLTAHTSVQGWLSGGRLERALMRLELASGTQPTEAGVQLLAAVDLVVVVDNDRMPRVTQVAELTLVETGYRPTLLFTTGHALSPETLMPVQPPSFVSLLAGIGQSVLAQDLLHGAASAMPTSQQAPTAAASPAAASPARRAAPAPKAQPHARAYKKQGTQASLAPMTTQPGWELDRLLATEPQADTHVEFVPAAIDPVHAAEAAEAASLAAQFGLGPPPPPTSRNGRSSGRDIAGNPSGNAAQVTTQDVVIGAAKPRSEPADGADAHLHLYEPTDDDPDGI